MPHPDRPYDLDALCVHGDRIVTTIERRHLTDAVPARLLEALT